MTMESAAMSSTSTRPMDEAIETLRRLIKAHGGRVSAMATAIRMKRPDMAAVLRDYGLDGEAALERLHRNVSGPRAIDADEKEAECECVLRVLTETAANRTHKARPIQGLVFDVDAAAAKLKMPRRTLYRRMGFLGIKAERPSADERKTYLVKTARQLAAKNKTVTQVHLGEALDVSHTAVQAWLKDLGLSIDDLARIAADEE